MSFRHPRGVRFQCTRCALCCGNTETRVRHIVLLKSEAEQIARITSRPIEQFAKNVEGHLPYAYEMKKTATEGKCLFLRDTTCIIYASRPLICRFYPFQLETAGNGKSTFSYTEECLGIGEGRQLRRSYFERLFEEVHKRLGGDKAKHN